MTKNHKSARWRRIFVCCLFFLSVSLTLSAQDLLVSGQVSDGQLPISGANVIIKNTTNGVVTDFDGHYTITTRPTDTLQISYLGYTTLTIPIQNRSTINVILKEDATALGEVQINAGYYTTTDREKTGSIARITAKDIELQPVNNPLGAMQGYMSGVNIVQNTGVPGGGYEIQIRGKNFINGGTDPLFIVDGVPYGGGSLGAPELSVEINGGNISPLNAIDMANIESIEVLKDADATAIYGSRGANGVVLITTKGGHSGKLKTQVKVSSSLGRVTHFLDLMGTDQYLEVRREGIINDGFEGYLNNSAFDFAWPDLKLWNQNRYTNWQKKLIGNTAFRNLATISLSGGSEQTQFISGGSYQKETTVFPGESRYKKISAYNKLRHHSADDRFKTVLSINYTHEDNNLPRADLTTKAYSLPPNAPELYNDEGEINWENNSWDNPIASLQEKYDVQISTLMANANILYGLGAGLSFKTGLGYTNYRLDSHRILPNTARNPNFGFTPETYSSINTNQSIRTSWIVEPQLSWDHSFGKTQLNILIGSTFQEQNTSQLVLRAKGFPNNSLIYNLAAANTLETLRDVDGRYNYTALFSRININYDGTYIINLTGRRDGSSRFGPGKRFGNFWAVGAAWIFSNESLIKNVKFLSFGKLRGSYGTTGSDNVGDYMYLNTYKVTGKDYDDTTIIDPTGIFNPLFGWETNKKMEVALELGLFNDRLSLNTSWYRNRSSNQLIGIPLAATTGFSSMTGNFDATVENRGWEFDFQTVNFKTPNFKWTTVFNFSLPKNKLIDFPGLESSTFSNRYIIGKPLTIVRLYHSLGVNPQTGLYEFEDYNEDGEIRSLDDKQWIEDLAPEFFGGFGNTLTYKNFSIDFFFQFKKQKAYNLFRGNPSPGFMKNMPSLLFERWRNVGDIAPVMKSTAALRSVGPTKGYFSDSNAAVSDASYIRLRNITLTYKLPSTLTGGLNANVYIQGQNLLTITDYDGPDPEQQSQIILPPLRQITLGVLLNF